MEFEYVVTAFKQDASPNSPTLVSLVATVEDIKTWGSIQGYVDETGQGFQRALDDTRRKDLTDFFDEPTNTSPTGISIAFRSGANVTLEPMPEFPDRDSLIVTNVKLKFELPDHIVDLLNTPEPSRPASVPDLRLRVREFLSSSGIVAPEEGDTSAAGSNPNELGNGDDSNPSADDFASSEGLAVDDGDDNADESDEDDSDEAPPDDEAGVDLVVGSSRLGAIYEGLAQDEWVLDNWDSLVDLLRPAVVIDGQHRIEGAAASRASIPFSLTAIMDASLEKQIVQFVLINVKQRKLNPRFTSGVFATYMDRERMEAVAEETGLDMSGPAIFAALDTMAESPFKGLIDGSETGSSTKLGYVTMMGLGRAWLKRKPRVLRARFKCYVRGPEDHTQAEYKERRDRDWEESFCWQLCFTFWKAVSDKYPDLWDDLETRALPVNYFRQAVVQEQLQEAFFEFWANQIFEFERRESEATRKDRTVAQLEEVTAHFLKTLPSDLFSVPWLEGTSLNDAKGRAKLSLFFRRAWLFPLAFKRKDATSGLPRWRSLSPVGETKIK